MRMRLKAKGHYASPRTAHIGTRTFKGTSKTPEQLDLFDALSLPKPA